MWSKVHRFFVALAAVVFAFAVPLHAQWDSLVFEVIDAQFSTGLNRLVMISKDPPQLHVYNPADQVDQILVLPDRPLSLSLSKDGMFAAVGHLSAVSYISLAPTPKIAKNLPISYAAGTVILADNDYIYTYPDLWVRISDGAEGLGNSGGPSYRFARLHPNGKVIFAGYSSIEKYDVSAGLPRRGTFADTDQCDRFTFLPTGRVITDCGRVYDIDPNPDSQISSVVSPLASRGAVAYSDAAPIATASVERVAFHDPATFAFLGETPFDKVPYDGTLRPISTRHIFYNRDASQLTVLGTLPYVDPYFTPWFIRTYDIAGRSSACSPTMTASASSLPAVGGSMTVAVTAPDNCLWRVVKNDAALQVEGGGYGIGGKTLSVYAPPSGRAAGQQFRLSVGASTAEVSQGPNTQPMLRAVFPGTVGDSDYDRPRDRIVLASQNPNLLQIWNTAAGGVVAAIDLPFPPLSIAIASDGSHAAVGYDAAFSYVDLASRRVLWTRGVDRSVRRIFLIADRIHVFVGEYDPPGRS